MEDILTIQELVPCKIKDLIEKCVKEVWPLLVFVNGSIIESLRIGSEVKVSPNPSAPNDLVQAANNAHVGFILGMTSMKTGHIKVSGFPTSLEVQRGQIQGEKKFCFWRFWNN